MSREPAPHRLKRGLLLACKVALSAGLIAVMLRSLDSRGVGLRLAGADWSAVGLSIAVALVLSLVHAVRWRRVIQAAEQELDFPATVRLVFIGYFFNQTLPSTVGGDAFRIWGSYRRGMPFGAAVGSVVLDRIVTLLALVLVSAVGLPWLLPLLPDPLSRLALTLLIGAGLGGWVGLLALGQLPRAWLNWPGLRPIAAFSVLARRLWRQPVAMAQTLGLSVLGIGAFVLIVRILFRALGVDLAWADCWLLLPPVILVTAVPLSIAGWGVREGAMVVAFGFIHIPPETAFTVSVLFGVVLTVASLPGSVLWWADVRARSRQPEEPAAVDPSRN